MTSPPADSRPHAHRARIFFGLLLVLTGIAYLLSQLGWLVDLEACLRWPLILVAVGLYRLIHPSANASRPWAFLILGMGVLFMLHYLPFVQLPWKVIWPVLIIVLGFLVLINSKALRRAEPRAEQPVPADQASPSRLQGFVLMGGKEHREQSKAFAGGEILCLLGGYQLDLREAEIQGPAATLNVRVIMGGVEIRVPGHWRVTAHGTPVLGGFEDKTRHEPPPAPAAEKRLVIDGEVLMGGLEIKN